MSLATFTFTDRARPIVEIGVGASNVASSVAVWDQARWDQDTSRWASVEPLWHDVSCYVIEAHIAIGRSSTTDAFQVGRCDLVIDNTTGWADWVPPPNDAWVLTMRPGRALRVSIEHATLGTFVLFRGFIDAIDPLYDPVQPDTMAIAALDALGEVNRGKLVPTAAPVGAGDPGDVRVGRILDRMNWPRSKRDLQATTTTLLASVIDGQVANLLGQAADSAGGAVFGDTLGRIAFRNRGWLVHNRDEPPDATIGNVDPGIPGYWVPGTPQIDGYLTPSVGYASTPDAPELHVTGAWRITARVRMDALPVSGYSTIAAQRLNSASDLAWHTGVNATQFVTRRSSDGTTFPGALNVFATMPPIGIDTTVSMDIPAATLWNSTAALAIGVRAVNATPADVWLGRIYWVQAETLDGGGNVTSLVWRFDANEFTGSGVSYTDPRGRTWTLNTASALTPMIPAVPDEWVPPVQGDICPVRWVRPFERAAITTRVLLNRAGAATPPFVFDDYVAQVQYGVEPYERVDLLTETDAELTRIGTRILETRGAATAPRIRSVSFNAATATDALDLMTTVDPYSTQRYRCRLAEPRGLVFDGVYFATGVRHDILPGSWSCDVDLDTAKPYASSNARWDSARWDADEWVPSI